jgi:phosphonate transport system ATP-binding protein
MIEVTGLRVALPPATVILDGVDLAVRPGEFVVILGKSGAGKTTLLRTINRLVEPTAGTIRVDGHLVTGAPPAALREIRRRIGMIFQQFNLVRRVSVMENVLAGRLGYVPRLSSLAGHFPPEDRRRALECLAQVGLAHLAERRADTLSGGEQQRVAIARALASKPAVIFADEPTGNLDSKASDGVLELLRRAVDEFGQTVVMVTHDAEAASVGDRLLVLRDGRICHDAASGTRDQVHELMRTTGIEAAVTR